MQIQSDRGTIDHGGSIAPPGAVARVSMGRAAALGASGGLAWGISIRLWMRFISTDPEFTWTGTGMILGFSVLAGTLLGIAHARRRRGGRGWWRLNGLGVLGLGAGAGMVMLPSVAVAGLAMGRRSWPAWVRGALVTGAVAFQWPLVGRELLELGVLRFVGASAAYLVLLLVEAWAVSIVFRPPTADAPPLGRLAGVALALIPIALLAVGVVATVGLA